MPVPPVFVINGFYMTMREKYTQPDATLAYYVVEWEAKDLSWGDFRGKVLGATDPAEAVEGSLRRTILDDYKNLGLTSVPNVGDNGMHASASPFEALAERCNWLGAKPEEDPFGKALLTNLPKVVLSSYMKDPQVELEDGKMGSLFDAMEDQDSDEIIAKANALAKVKDAKAVDSVKNMAFVFIKPHAVTDAVKKLVDEKFAAAGLKVVSKGVLTGKEIDEGKLIDNHYYSIACKASLTLPKDLNPSEKAIKAFSEKFGAEWKDALAANVVFNAKDATTELGFTGDELNDVWAKAKKAGSLVKFGGGFYCANVAPFLRLFTINGFYMTMREKYTSADAKLQYYVVEWDAKDNSWADFRGSVLGATDPAEAVKGSLRRTILDDYKALGLTSVPNVGDNGMHASASPFEALAERCNWLGAKVEEDTFGKALLTNLDAKMVGEWMKDPQVELEDGTKGSLFDAMEDQDSDDIVKKANALAKVKDAKAVDSVKNMAFVFIKPHAVTDAVKKLVEEKFAAAKFTIVQQGELTGKQIDEGKLIDNHYYSIACKATLSQPKDLNPSTGAQAQFLSNFGIDWKSALDAGIVLNAADCCAKLGCTGGELDAMWAKAKKAGKLVKFGGGFYCGNLALFVPSEKAFVVDKAVALPAPDAEMVHLNFGASKKQKTADKSDEGCNPCVLL